VTWNIGLFLNAVIKLLIVAFAVFWTSPQSVEGWDQNIMLRRAW
jgi:large-conductance mechanosensitive channel